MKLYVGMRSVATAGKRLSAAPQTHTDDLLPSNRLKSQSVDGKRHNIIMDDDDL